jgi:FHS family L-fucose permease-like MFS transporter
MVAMTNTGGNITKNNNKSIGNNAFALISLTSLFFMWGFITALNDILIPHLKGVFDLSYTQAMLVQFCFFSAYLVVSIPAGKLVKQLGFKYGIVSGLIIAGLGCMLFYPAAAMQTYNLFLAALFVLASGITILQVSANPYVAALGASETASSRLTMTQAFNSLGTTVAPFFGAFLILGAATVGIESMTAEQISAHEAESVQMPYLLLAGMLFILAAIFAKLKLPKIEAIEEVVVDKADSKSAWSYSHLVLGAVGIFAYVGAEVSIGSFLINFLGEENIAGLAEAEAANYIAIYWGGAMIGRFIGFVLLQKFDAGKVLAAAALSVSLLILAAVFSQGNIAMWAILSVGLFNSIMFPTIFSLAINGLGSHTSQGSGILCLAIVGGAILPLIQGMIADTAGIQISFLMPLICYAFIVYYGLKGSKPKHI